MRTIFKATRDFERDFKKLAKKYKSLKNDLQEFKKVLPFVSFNENKNFAVLHDSKTYKIIKARFSCRYLRNNPAMRIILAQFNKNEYEFIEIYFKGDKENEDRQRILDFQKNV